MFSKLALRCCCPGNFRDSGAPHKVEGRHIRANLPCDPIAQLGRDERVNSIALELSQPVWALLGRHWLRHRLQVGNVEECMPGSNKINRDFCCRGKVHTLWYFCSASKVALSEHREAARGKTSYSMAHAQTTFFRGRRAQAYHGVWAGTFCSGSCTMTISRSTC